MTSQSLAKEETIDLLIEKGLNTSESIELVNKLDWENMWNVNPTILANELYRNFLGGLNDI